MKQPTTWRARLPRGRQAVITVVALVVTVVALVLVVAPGWAGGLVDAVTGRDEEDAGIDERFLDYCDEVRAQQDALSQAADAGSSGLIDALPSFRALQAEAPDDLTDEWATVVGRVGDLAEALEAAGVDDPDDYDAKNPPEGITREQQQAIEAAARRLVEPGTVQALDGVQQQARDVCRIPLTR